MGVCYSGGVNWVFHSPYLGSQSYDESSLGHFLSNHANFFCTHICMFWGMVGLYCYSFILLWWKTFGCLLGMVGATTSGSVLLVFCSFSHLLLMSAIWMSYKVYFVICALVFANLLSDSEMFSVFEECWGVLMRFILFPSFWPLSMLNLRSFAVFCFSEWML